jgi:hypothetical protein
VFYEGHINVQDTVPRCVEIISLITDLVNLKTLCNEYYLNSVTFHCILLPHFTIFAVSIFYGYNYSHVLMWGAE